LHFITTNGEIQQGMSGPSRAVGGATLLLQDLLPELIGVVCHWSSSDSRSAIAARDTLKHHGRPFHVSLYWSLHKLYRALLWMQTYYGRNNDASIRPAVTRILDILEDQVVVISRGSPRSARGWSFRGSRSSRTYGNLLSWIADSRSRDEEKLPWLLETTRLANLPEHVRSDLIDAVTSCFQQIQKVLPIDVTAFDCDDISKPFAAQREPTRCTCSHPHTAPQPAIDSHHNRKDPDRIFPMAAQNNIPRRVLNADARSRDDAPAKPSDRVVVSNLPLPKTSGFQGVKVTIDSGPAPVPVADNGLGAQQLVEESQ
jgi:hypothetical protein